MNLDQRQRVLAAARLLAAKHGLRAVTVRGVAREAGIGASTLRYYFPSQEALYSSVIAEELDRSLSDLRIEDSSLSAEGRLVECLRQFLPTTPQEVNLLSQWTAGLVYTEPDLANRILEIVSERARAKIRYWLDLLHAEGSIQRTQPNFTVSLLSAVVNGLAIDLAASSPSISGEDAENILRSVVTKFVQ